MADGLNFRTGYDPASAPVILRGSGLTREFGSRKSLVTAVDHVDFTIHEGEIVSIVGESGSGKTTTMRMIMGLLSPTSGKITYSGQPVDFRDMTALRRYWLSVQAIFQDPFSSFNQFYQIEKIFYDCLDFRGLRLTKSQALEKIRDACRFVNLEYNELEGKYPFELSGGQMQRLMIARIFLMEPKVLIADEPTSMVDACSRSTILEMLLKLRQANNMTIIFITHDLGLAYFVSNTIYIMEKGRFVEADDAREVINNPKSEYAKRLLSDVPKLHEAWEL